MNTLILNVGDLVAYEGKLYPITKLSSTGVIVSKGKTNHFINCNGLLNRKFEYCVPFEKNGVKGETHATTEDGALKEKELLESIGWKVSIYKREVI